MSSRLGAGLGALVGLAFALATILVAATVGFEESQDTFTTMALLGVIFFIGIVIILAVAGRISSFFPSFAFGFCVVAAPASLASTLIGVFAGHTWAALGFGAWAVELALCYFIVDAVASRKTASQGSITTTHPPTIATSISTTLVATGPKFGQTLRIWGLDMTVGKPAVDSDAVFVGEGNRRWVAHITVKNVGSQDRPYNLLYYIGRDDEGSECTMRFGSKKPELNSGDLSPGDIVQGYLPFELPRAREIVSVTFKPFVLGTDVSVTWER